MDFALLGETMRSAGGAEDAGQRWGIRPMALHLVGCHGPSGACPCQFTRPRASSAWPVAPLIATALAVLAGCAPAARSP